MSKNYIDSTLGYMRQNVSPNRAKLISMFNPMIMSAKYTRKPDSHFAIPGFSGFTAKFGVGKVFGAYMTIWNDQGEEILSYTSPPNAGWSETQTKDKHHFIDEADAIYMKVYDETLAQMKAEAAAGSFHLNVQV